MSQPLVRDAVLIAHGHAVGDEHDRLPVQPGMGDAVHGAGRARAPGDDAGAGTPGELGRCRGHQRGGALGVGEDEPQPGRLGCADDVEVGSTTGEPEQERRAGLLQRVGQQIGHGPHRRRSAGRHRPEALSWRRYE